MPYVPPQGLKKSHYHLKGVWRGMPPQGFKAAVEIIPTPVNWLTHGASYTRRGSISGKGKVVTGTYLWELSLHTRPSVGNPVADINQDDIPEIIFNCICEETIHCYAGNDGTRLWTYNTGITFSCCGQSTYYDIDGDGNLEIYNHGKQTLTVLKADGTLLWDASETATENSLMCYGGNVVEDIDGDDRVEFVVLGRDDGKVHCYDAAEGTELWEYDTGAGGVDSFAANSVNLYDIDEDGAKELIAGCNDCLLYTSPSPRD